MTNRWTTSDVAAHLRRMGSADPVTEACQDRPKVAKYRNAKTTTDGITFASKAEARHYQALKIVESTGAITGLKLQPRFELQPKFTDADGKKHRAVVYVADFEFMRKGERIGADMTREGIRTVVDVKGVETAAFKIKWKLVIARYPEIKFEVWK